MKIPIDWIAVIAYAASLAGMVLMGYITGTYNAQMSNSIAIYGGVVVLACIGYCKWKRGKMIEKVKEKEKIKNILSERWDILIILDSCRYDYFEKHYNKYFNGTLEKVNSPATWTVEWLTKTFPGRYDDIVYFSGNAFVNSKMEIKHDGLTFSAKDKFYKVIDVWDTCLDETIDTVHPRRFNKLFLERMKLYPNKRFILHYLQPHSPFVSFTEYKFGSFEAIPKKTNRMEKLAKNTLGELKMWKVLEFLGRASVGLQDFIIRKYGMDGLKEEYEKNLVLVLEEISKMLPQLKGRIIITADHGEMLGEHGRVGHSGMKNYKELLEVPFFVVDNTVRIDGTF